MNMATKAQIEAAKKALEAGQGIGAAIDAAEAAAWEKIDNLREDDGKVLGTDGENWAAVSLYESYGLCFHHGDYVSDAPKFTHYRPLPKPPKMEE